MMFLFLPFLLELQDGYRIGKCTANPHVGIFLLTLRELPLLSSTRWGWAYSNFFQHQCKRCLVLWAISSNALECSIYPWA